MFSLSEIAAITNGQVILSPSSVILSEAKNLKLRVNSAKDPEQDPLAFGLRVTGVSCDSRTIKPGDLFIPLKGDHFDGHSFLKEVFLKGASAALSDHWVAIDHPIIVVKDTLKALQKLAQHYKKRFSVPTIAVTGSAGKTTTKECIGAALSNSFKIRVGVGNLNNHIGVPLNIFKLQPFDQCAVFELGANHSGEIKLLSEIVQPSVGVITGICPVHLEGFGSLERIYDAKLELADYLNDQQGTVIANGDDLDLKKRLQNRRFNLITFGKSHSCDYRISHLRTAENKILFNVNEKYHFQLKGYGLFNAPNALAAIATAAHFKINLEALSQSWIELPRIQNRFIIDHWSSCNLLIVDDSYNANPKSFEQAVESFKEIAKDRRKIIVVGDMLELGEQSSFYHELLGHFIAGQKIDALITVGSLSRFALNAFRKLNSKAVAIHFDKIEPACSYLTSNLREGDSVLIKGSHGVELFKIKPYLEEHFNITSASV